MLNYYKEKLGDVRQEGMRVRGEVRDRVASYIVGGLGVVVGLAWNEAIKGAIDYFYPLAGANSIFAKFLYATILTTVVVLVTIYVVRPPEKK